MLGDQRVHRADARLLLLPPLDQHVLSQATPVGGQHFARFVGREGLQKGVEAGAEVLPEAVEGGDPQDKIPGDVVPDSFQIPRMISEKGRWFRSKMM